MDASFITRFDYLLYIKISFSSLEMACHQLSFHQSELTLKKIPLRPNSTTNTINLLKKQKAMLTMSMLTLVSLQPLEPYLTCPNLPFSTRLCLITNNMGQISTISLHMPKQGKKNESNDGLKRIGGQSGILAFGVAVHLWKLCWKFIGR